MFPVAKVWTPDWRILCDCREHSRDKFIHQLCGGIFIFHRQSKTIMSTSGLRHRLPIPGHFLREDWAGQRACDKRNGFSLLHGDGPLLCRSPFKHLPRYKSQELGIPPVPNDTAHVFRLSSVGHLRNRYQRSVYPGEFYTRRLFNSRCNVA